ncbi:MULTISPECIES: nucleoside 2-deoxyribosyltransferase [unclassified Caballeronia]|uniref:nucleoside 2-deoxyribosyltransferase n=1 Tax=unclassified Caballeronia TaxID=2646786 RepID=UPI00285647CA|nr:MULTISPECIES: nucleoside 2-deoxyribosyltransferase [unclassified Caballeronia]MDR5755124.1 nucleoside 2-deoxyribosyltransferase [Caballeronia sp. LZ024]MDR5845334.1 nucleoside 2-deoxyribosyltransferase [Caballeronia sp. LZ031]
MRLNPLDGELPSSLQGEDAARWTFGANIDLIRSAEIVMARLDDFRGSDEPDSGTAFEVGFAVARGTPLWAYRSTETTLAERVKATTVNSDGGICEAGYLIEDFGLRVNLMLACSAHIVVGGPDMCLDAIAPVLDGAPPVLGGSGLAKR